MPADIQCQIEHVIRSTLDDYSQAHGSPSGDSSTNRSHEASIVEEQHNLKHLNRVLCDLENRASRIVGEGHPFNALEHGPVAVDYRDREKRTQFDSLFDQVSASLGRLEKLHIRLEACPLLQIPPTLSVSAPLSEDDSLRKDDLEKSELFLQSVDHFLISTFNLVRTMM